MSASTAPELNGITAQASAHGDPIPVEAAVAVDDAAGSIEVRWADSQRRVAPGQSIVLYAGDVVLGGGLVADGCALLRRSREDLLTDVREEPGGLDQVSELIAERPRP